MFPTADVKVRSEMVGVGMVVMRAMVGDMENDVLCAKLRKRMGR